MEELAEGLISVAAGLAGDTKGAKYPSRQITVLSREAWDAALAEIGGPHLAWTARRANLLVAGVELPRAKGAVLSIGSVRLEVTGQTYPCVRMEEAHPGAFEGAGQGLARRADVPGRGRRPHRRRAPSWRCWCGRRPRPSYDCRDKGGRSKLPIERHRSRKKAGNDRP